MQQKNTDYVKATVYPSSTEYARFPAAKLGLGMRNHRRRMGALMLFADLLGFAFAVFTLLLLNSLFHFFSPGPDDLKYLVVLTLCIGFFTTSRLHPGVGINPAEEIRLVTQFISLSIMIGLVIFTVFDVGWVANAFVFLLAWLGSILSVLMSRWGVKILAARAGLWGEPVIVAGKDPSAKRIVRFFLKRRRLGFVPVGVALESGKLNSMPSLSLGTLEKLPENYYSQSGIQTVLVSNLLLLQPAVADKLFKMFKHVVFIANTGFFEGASLKIYDFEGLLAFEAKRNSLSSNALFVKRCSDIVLSVMLGLLLWPICLFVALLIWLEGRGPILYSQERIGFGGLAFRVFKFRTMVIDADKKLNEYLQSNIRARQEWDQTQKLRSDPRITRVGRFLRKWSLDEIPQIVNVFKGDMSFVGPRPMMGNQTNLYGEKIGIYYGMRPGISGLWQVSGRNQTTFEERANFDVYYVRNWSIWLDIYIIFRTAWVVLRRSGAY